MMPGLNSRQNVHSPSPVYPWSSSPVRLYPQIFGFERIKLNPNSRCRQCNCWLARSISSGNAYTASMPSRVQSAVSFSSVCLKNLKSSDSGFAPFCS